MFASSRSDGVDHPADGSPLDPDWERRRARHAQPDGDADETGEWDSDDWDSDDWDDPEDFRSVVRPYSWTRGRTRPVQDLALETLVSTSDEGRDLSSVCSAEHAAIAQLCTEIRSVAEVAALLVIPLGVARVLLADMIDTGLVCAHSNPAGWGSAPDRALLERVLDGLHRL